MNRKAGAIFILLVLPLALTAQDPSTLSAEEIRRLFPQGRKLSVMDSINLSTLPSLPVPADALDRWLPPSVDNSTLPYLRPVFSQDGPSCGQAASVGYNFTFEINSLRDLPADTIINQYPTHFTWNFQNGGEGWYGVSYFHSFEILRQCGCMNVADYGGQFYDDGQRWISGYDVYHNGMHNRIKGVYSIRTSTEEGILTLKNWLYDRLGATSTGGVASFYSNPPYVTQVLNDTTPEGGKHIVTGFYPAATHAMTIVGYNDDIRWDYNSDGQYTNDIDLNGDGILDPRDWEFGAFKVVNSYGNFLDSGFYYMMYKVAAETFHFDGGIWNQSVHVVEADPDYSPLLTFKITLKHDTREMIKVRAGVSKDTADSRPEWTMDFPIFDYQGGHHYMQGQDTAEFLMSIEFGLDVTPLLAQLEPGSPARFFLIVDENDIRNEGFGEITSFSLLDYSGGETEVVCTSAPMILENNSSTWLSVVHGPSFEPVRVITGELPPFIPGAPYTFHLEADGGEPPYAWSIDQDYVSTPIQEALPLADEVQLMPNVDGDTIIPVALGFPFPFFGKKYDTVWAHVDGYLQFSPDQLPWPYILETKLFMQSFRMIAPACHNNLMINIPDGDGVWHEGNDSMAVFRWQVSSQADQDLSEMHFGVAIYPSGIIELFTGELHEGGLGLVSGISQGNKKNFLVLFEPGLAPLIPSAATRLSPEWFPEGMNISREGNFTGTPPPGNTIYSVNFRVTDERRVSSARNLIFTPGPWINLRPMLEEGSQLSFGDTVAFVLQVKNFTGQTLEDLTMTMAEDDPFAFFPDDLAEIGSLAPGDSLTIPGAFQMEVSPIVPDMHPMICRALLETGEQGLAWQQQFIFSPAAPRIFVERFTIDDGNNGLLEPGETAQLGIVLANLGHAGIEDVTGMLEPIEDGIYVTSDPAWAFGLIPKMNTVEATFTIFADPDLPAGFKGHLVMGWSSASGLQGSDTLEIRVGKVPVLVVDLDPNQLSGPAIAGALDQLGVAYEYEQEFPGVLGNYYSIFLCLGQRFSNHVLTWNEGNQLKSFLDENGLMYMEGWDTWGYDPMTPLHPMFHIGTVPVLTTFNDIEGEPGTFAEGMLFSNNSSYTFDFYHLVPAGPPAFSILKSHENQVSCAVAYDAGSYRTVGANIELGQLGDGLFPSTKVNLMSGILEFFEIQTYPVHIQEKESASGLQAMAYPNPTLGLLTLRITTDTDPGASIQLFDITGREVALNPGRSVRTEGIQLITLQIPPSCPGGIYIYKISGNEGTVTGKVHLLR